MIQLFKNLQITNSVTNIFVNNQKGRSKLTFGQSKPDTFEKSNIYKEDGICDESHKSQLTLERLRKAYYDNKIFEEIRKDYPEMSYEEFSKATELLKIRGLCKKPLSDAELCKMTLLPPRQFKQAKEILYVKERGKNQLNGWNIINIAKLPPEQFKQAKQLLYIKERGQSQLSDWIFSIAQLLPEQFKQAKEILFIKELGKILQLTGEEIINIAELPPEKFKQAKELLHVKGRGKNIITPHTIFNIARLPAEQFSQAKALSYIPDFGQDQLSGNEIYWTASLPVELFAGIKSSIKRMFLQKEKVMAHPELYVNGNIKPSLYHSVVSTFFRDNRTRLMELGTVYDDDCINNILRLRFNDAEEIFEKFYTLNNSYKVILSKLVNSKDINGKPFSSLQKTDFIDICAAYQALRISTNKIGKMISENRVDIEELKRSVFEHFMKQLGFTQKEISKIPHDKLSAWDRNYLHKLHDECKVSNRNRYNEENEYESEYKYKYESALIDLISAANSERSFFDYIHDTHNKYGQTNAKTKQAFTQLKLNYRNWIHPKSEAISFNVKDKNTESISQIILQLEEDMNELRKNDAVREFVDKRFSKYIKGRNFLASYINNKTAAEHLVKELIKQLSPLKQRAENNVKNHKNLEAASAALTIFSHLEQRLDDIKKIPNNKREKSINWTIKMWDRFPQRDLFQGNYSTCCIGIGNGNGKAMPHYLLDTAFNMIEIIDSKSGKIKGNALCYFVKDQNNKPIFIIDNIEITNSDKLSNEKGIELRNAIAEYATKVAKEVTGKDDIAVCIGSNFNDVPVNDLKGQNKRISFIGNIDCPAVYMDLFDGWAADDDYTNISRKLLKLK